VLQPFVSLQSAQSCNASVQSRLQLPSQTVLTAAHSVEQDSKTQLYSPLKQLKQPELKVSEPRWSSLTRHSITQASASSAAKQLAPHVDALARALSLPVFGPQHWPVVAFQLHSKPWASLSTALPALQLASETSAVQL
jgi:hypothetical protein